MSKFSRFTLNLFIYLVIIGGVIFGLPKALTWALNTPYPMAAITSGSMWPVLNEGDLVFVQGVAREDLRVGDIIVFRNEGGSPGRSAGGGFTIHRIAKLEPNQLVTKGDANFNPDSPINYDQVVGRSWKLAGRLVHIPYLGSITVMASNWKK